MEQSTIVTTPNYPLSYPNHLDCVWYFTSNDSPYGAFLITIYIAVVEILYDTFSIGKGLTVTSESRVVKIDSATALSSVSVDAPAMWIRFASDQSVGYEGVLIKIQRVTEKGTHV